MFLVDMRKSMADHFFICDPELMRRSYVFLIGRQVSKRRTIGQGVFGFREIVGEEFMTMFLSVFSRMVQNRHNWSGIYQINPNYFVKHTYSFLIRIFIFGYL